MEVILSAVAVVFAAGCFLAIVASDLRENELSFLLKDASWLATPETRGKAGAK
jgi:hypothetical protein